MYKDAKEELQRLEDALLEEDVPEEEMTEELTVEEEVEQSLLEATRRIEGLEQAREFGADLAATRRIYNADQLDVELEEYAEAVQEEPKNLNGLLITAGAMAAAVVGFLVWWLLRYGVLFQ